MIDKKDGFTFIHVGFEMYGGSLVKISAGHLNFNTLKFQGEIWIEIDLGIMVIVVIIEVMCCLDKLLLPFLPKYIDSLYSIHTVLLIILKM